MELRTKPKISVVTVLYNAAKVLEQTMLSVLNQSYDNIEYIIIDGGSTDGSAEIIRKYAKNLAYWVSEPDNGIYDAMNKGILKASGDWIHFMNAGDTFFDRDTVKNVFAEKIAPDVEVIYGDCCLKTFGFYFLVSALSLDYLKTNMPFSHQATFTKLETMRKYLFDTQYKICADYNFFYKLYQKNVPFFYIQRMLCIYDGSGISSTHTRQLRHEVSRINGEKEKNSAGCSFLAMIRLPVQQHFFKIYSFLKHLQFVLFPTCAEKYGWKKLEHFDGDIK